VGGNVTERGQPHTGHASGEFAEETREKRGRSVVFAVDNAKFEQPFAGSAREEGCKKKEVKEKPEKL
jgi:hypothetical protein